MRERERCVCGHPLTLHKLNPQIGDRNECWALNADQMVSRYCQCHQYRATRDEGGAGS